MRSPQLLNCSDDRVNLAARVLTDNDVHGLARLIRRPHGLFRAIHVDID